MDLARSEVELINPRVSGTAYALLRSYGMREWHDVRGNWHVVVSAGRIPEIEQAERQERRRGGRRQVAPGHDFKSELARATARLKARDEAFQRSLYYAR